MRLRRFLLLPIAGASLLTVASLGTLAASSTGNGPAPESHSPTAILIDGAFDDWQGMPFIEDASSDVDSRPDITRFRWNSHDSNAFYWMIETVDLVGDARFQIRLDMDDDGLFEGQRDRTVVVEHGPSSGEGEGRVWIKNAADNATLATYGSSAVSSSSRINASGLEVAVQAVDLGYSFGSVYRMRVETSGGDLVPDAGDIQVYRGLVGPQTPSGQPSNVQTRIEIEPPTVNSSSVAAKWAAGAILLILWVGATLFFRMYRIWIFYYVTGGVGLALLVIVVGQASNISELLASGVAASAAVASNAVGIPARVFSGEPSSLMVFVIGQLVGSDNGWTIVRLSVESSSLLEAAVLLGAIMFLPAQTFGRRLVTALLSVIAIYLANIIRLTVIIIVLHVWGKQSLFISHTVIGRAVFFVLVIAVFWYAVTRPTLRTVSARIMRELAA